MILAVNSTIKISIRHFTDISFVFKWNITRAILDFIIKYQYNTECNLTCNIYLSLLKLCRICNIRFLHRQNLCVGKISDIFLGRGITQTVLTHSNTEGMEAADLLVGRSFRGLCFINLVDFDQLWGHRNDVAGYAAGFAAFDAWLSDFIEKLGDDDALIITADHGCDPGAESTDHTREYTPLLVYGKQIKPISLGTRTTFADIGKTVCELLDCGEESKILAGTGFAGDLLS